MKVGEVRKLTIPYVMAYGENSLEGIPPYSDLYFEVELVSAEKPMEPDVFPKDVNKLAWKAKDKGLKIYDEKAGTGKPAVVGSTLKVHYTGSFDAIVSLVAYVFLLKKINVLDVE